MWEDLKERVCRANLELVAKGVVMYTWGNVSEIDREAGVMAIKPSGVSYDGMQPDDMVIIDIETGKPVEGKWRPSSDTATHIELYKAFDGIGGIAHTHSVNAVSFAQAGLSIPPLGTTHADHFYGAIPCTRELTATEIDEAYELNTGRVIIEHFEKEEIDPVAIPGALVRSHGPFAWGVDSRQAVYHAVSMETIAEMALKTLFLNQNAVISQYTMDKHYFRKHGSSAYYGQEANL